MRRFVTLAVIFLLAFSATASAQRVAVKTNALYLATATPNVGFEFAMAPRWTFEIAGGYNPWTYDAEENIKAKHFLVTPEFRYWFCERFQGHHLGLHTGYMFYNVGAIRIPFQPVETKFNRYQGWATGVGLSYGYTWILGKRLNLEASIGVGYAYTKYDIYECKNCGDYKGPGEKHYVGPTKLALNLIYMIK